VSRTAGRTRWIKPLKKTEDRASKSWKFCKDNQGISPRWGGEKSEARREMSKDPSSSLKPMANRVA